jgi:hypothetical protein
MDDDILTESPEEKAFFDSKGAETVEVKSEPELPLAPEPPEPPKEVQEPEPRVTKVVPLPTLLEESREAKIKLEKVMARIDKLQELIQPPAPPPERPDPNVDPIGALKEAQERLDRFENQGKESAEIQTIANFGRQHAEAFRQQKPDFDEAYNHLRVSRANQLMNEGKVDSPEALNKTILAEEKEIIQMCAKMGVSPAAFMYNLAAAVGYTPKGQEAPQAPQAPAQPTAEEKVKMAAEGQARASNPVSKAGAGGNGKVDLKALAMLDDDEFDKATSGKNWSKMWN